MPVLNPPNAHDVSRVVEDRLAALAGSTGLQETATVMWRGQKQPIPVISMPVGLLHYNPDTRRVRAQRSLDPVRNQELDGHPYGAAGQKYLHDLLMGDPADPSKTDPAFGALKEDLRQHGQSEPGIMTRSGVLINGNTRLAALRDLGQEQFRVAVLPPDAAHDDLQTIELSLQLHKDFKREYSFMNFLLAVDEQEKLGRPAADIQRDFRIRAATYDRSRWILAFIRDAIKRSHTGGSGGQQHSMRLVDFETHQGKLEELYRAYTALKTKSPDDAGALREQRLLALALDKSKTDLRLIEPDFTERYWKTALPGGAGDSVKIIGIEPRVQGPSQKVEALKKRTDEVLQAKAIQLTPGAATPEALTRANDFLAEFTDFDGPFETALWEAGKNQRLKKRRHAAVEQLADANDALELAQRDIATARSTGSFDADDLDEELLALKSNIVKLARGVLPGTHSTGEGVAWLRAAGASLPGRSS